MVLDPRFKTLGESKYKEFKGWFDQRLDDAIAAAELSNNTKDFGKKENGNYRRRASFWVHSLLLASFV